MRLIFPHYNQESSEGMSVRIVSENQLEHVIKLCNTYRKSVRSIKDHSISAYKGINILLDYSIFDQIKRVNIPDNKCKTEPGITLASLNNQLKMFNFYVPYIMPGLNENADQIQLDQAVQENRICLQSLKYGHFKDQALERVQFVSGEGRMIQTGGYKVRDTYSFGFNIADLFSGSNYTIGLLFEVVVNCFKQKHNHSGKLLEVQLNQVSDISQIVRNFKEYVDSKDEKQQSLVDAVIISNLNQTEGFIQISSFDFNLNSAQSIKDLQSQVVKNLKSVKQQKTQDATLNVDFVQKFAFQSTANRGVDQELVLTVSLGNGIYFVDEFKEMFKTYPFQIHLLKKYIHIKICFDSTNEEHKVLLDKITSEAIRIGGTVKASRKVLSMISPYLDKRILGNYNMKVHNGLKQTFDPRDVLNPSSFFYLREKQDKSAFQRMKDKNKQFNYMFSLKKMIKDLIQYKFGDSANFTQLRTPQHRRSTSDQRSIIGKLGDPKKNSDKLRFLLLSIRFPQAYDDQEAVKGHPTQFMKIISYAMFVASSSVKHYLYSKGVDPDTVYMNDLKFMSKLFKILVSIFGYKPSITLEQFFKYGYAEQKMLLCCDVINLVKKCSKDIKVQRSLSRKRSQTSREAQINSYSIVDHEKPSGGQKSYVYERDHVSKEARVKALDKQYLDHRRSLSNTKRVSIQERQSKSPVRLSAGSNSKSTRSFQYSHVQSRYLLPQRSIGTLNRTIESENANNLSSTYKPLRVRASLQSHEQEHQPPKDSQQPAQPYQTPSFQQSQESVILQIKEAIVMLNQKFQSFQNVVDKKIDTIHNDYQTLQSKLETVYSTKNQPLSQNQREELRERGQLASPYHFSDVGRATDEKVNPLKEFTFSEKGAAQRAMYSTDAFSQQKHQQIQDELRDESRTLIESIRKNLDESKKALETYKSEPHFAQN